MQRTFTKCQEFKFRQNPTGPGLAEGSRVGGMGVGLDFSLFKIDFFTLILIFKSIVLKHYFS